MRKTNGKFEAVTLTPAYFRDRVAIDRNDLDSCVLEQPQLYSQISEQLALAVSRRDQLKHELEQEVAKVESKIRGREEKMTEKAVQNQVELSKGVAAIKDDLLEANAVVGRWNGVRADFDMRKDMLKIAAQLYASGYFTRAGVSGAHSSIVDTQAGEVRAVAGSERRSRMKD